MLQGNRPVFFQCPTLDNQHQTDEEYTVRREHIPAIPYLYRHGACLVHVAKHIIANITTFCEAGLLLFRDWRCPLSKLFSQSRARQSR